MKRARNPIPSEGEEGGTSVGEETAIPAPGAATLTLTGLDSMEDGFCV